MNATPTREALVTSVARHEEELEQALDELKEAVQRPFALGDHLAQHIGQHPIPWLVGAVVVGLWLGSRSQ
jgi:hypothetical protein